MKSIPTTTHRSRVLSGGLMLLLGHVLTASGIPATLDTFENSEPTSLETPRLVITDAQLGGASKADIRTEDGILRVEGTIAPGRGQPGFVSMVLILSPDGSPQDLSIYEGIRLRVHVSKGGLQVLAASSKVVNFDYHTTPVPRTKTFTEIRIPFSDLKRVWSEQTPLDLRTITSVNLVASGMQPGAFAYAVDEIGFY